MKSKISKEKLTKAIEGAFATRGGKKGKLLAKCPKIGTPEGAAWQAIQFHANPYKHSAIHVLFLEGENRIIYDTIVDALQGVNVSSADRDADFLTSLGVW